MTDDVAAPQGELGRIIRRRPLALLKSLGPGVVAGASDNDPTTVASLSVIGATTTYGLSWLVILVIPMLVVVQLISAAVGVVTRVGLEDAIRQRYGRVWAAVALLLVLVVNVITLSADLEGGSAALGLLTGWPYQWFIIPLALAVAGVLIWGSYAGLERILRYVLLIFLAYIVTAFLARPDWGAVLHATVVPHLEFSSTYVAGVLALLGTSLTSYAYVWETIEVAEERPPLRRLGLVQLDAGLGMVLSGAIFWFIVIGTGATLGVHHKQVQTAQDAAAALAPLAGNFASLIFGVGLLASAVLAIPVLAGTSAYVMAEAFGWKGSLNLHFGQARPFYVSLVLSLALAVGLTLFGISPITFLFWSSLAGGLGTPVTLALLMLVARDRTLMGEQRIGTRLVVAGWAVTTIVVGACIAFLVQTITGGGLPGN